MRSSLHSGKGYIRHQDHEETKRGRDYIDYSLTKNNEIWTRAGQTDKKDYTAEEGERRFYNDFFAETLSKQNEKYEKKGNYNRVRTMDEWMLAKQHSPSEQILQVGDKKEFVPMSELFPMIVEYVNWKQDTYAGNYEIISITGHVDEVNHADHIHLREVWFGHDEDGLPVPGIKAGLRELGVDLPDPNAPEGAKNYRKQTVDAECRKKWQEIILQHGYQIETEPDKTRSFGHMGRDAWNAYQDSLAEVKNQKKALAGEKRELRVQQHLVKSQKKAQESVLSAEREEIRIIKENALKTEIQAKKAYSEVDGLLKETRNILESAKSFDSAVADAPPSLVEFAKKYTKKKTKTARVMGRLQPVLDPETKEPIVEVHNCFDDWQHELELTKKNEIATKNLLDDVDYMEKRKQKSFDKQFGE